MKKFDLPFGATLKPDGTAHFRLWAPSAPAIVLELDGQDVAMTAGIDGWHETSARAHAGSAYRYRLPDGLRVPDPASRAQAADVNGDSLVIDPSHAWRTPGWMGRPWHEAVIYEVHAGLAGGFDGIRADLKRLRDLGITVVEIMPVADFPGGRNWGYDGVLPYAPDHAYGSPAALKALVDEAHDLGLMVMLDVVYNHFGPDGNYLHAYAEPFFRDDIKTPWGAAIDFRRPQVREFFLQNALYWLLEYRFDGLRFDAVHAITDDTFLDELAHTVRSGVEPGRHVHLVLEHEGNKSSLLGQPKFDAQWADDFHHCLHVLLTGEREGYYEDFQDATALLARCLAEGFAYQGQPSPHLGVPRGEPSGHLPTSAFVVCLQNHDQIGNRAMGDRLSTLTDPGRLRAATALLLLSPFVPLVFMGDEWATKQPFLFFTSHNEELAKLIREGRRGEFKHFAAFQDEAKRALIPDPNAPPTYDASRPDEADRGMAQLYSELLDIRRTRLVPHLADARSMGVEVLGTGALRARWRLGSSHLTLHLNLGEAEVELGASGVTLFSTLENPGPALPPGHLVATLA